MTYNHERAEETWSGLKFASFGPIYERKPCPDCNGTGRTAPFCFECGEDGTRRQHQTFYDHTKPADHMFAEATDPCDTCGEYSEPGTVATCSDCEGFTEYAGDEGSFSHSSCELCGSGLSGNRYVYHWVDSDGAINHESDACGDCLCYLSTGDLPED